MTRGAGFLAFVIVLCIGWQGDSTARGGEPRSAAAQPRAKAERNHKRILLLWQNPDGHPWATHEYQDGVRILDRCLKSVPNLQTIVTRADEPWTEGPELLDGADGAFLFLAEGARWIERTPARRAAFENLAKRGGGLVVLHWGMGTRDAAHVAGFLKLFGGCHGGPDRKYRVLSTRATLRSATHPVLRGIEPFDVEDEFYYRLKFAAPPQTIMPLVDVTIDGQSQTVAWAWERPAGGRSVGFSGGHFHRNWQLVAYRRLVAQAILWSVGTEIPEQGVPVDIPLKQLELDRPQPKSQ